MNFAYDVSVETAGGKFLKAGYFYRAKITKVEENKGFLNLYVESEGGETTQYSSLSQKIGTEYTQKTVSGWAFAVIMSNTEKDSDAQKKALEGLKAGFNPEKWIGYKIGFVADQQYNNPKFADPAWARDYNSNENATLVDEAKYKVWFENSKAMGNTSAPTNSGFGSTPPPSTSFNEQDLPF